MKILLICCPSAKKFLPLESIGLGYLASILRNKGHDVEILDVDLQYSFIPIEVQLQIIKKHINDNIYDLIGLSINDESYIPATNIILMIRELKIKKQVWLVLGGYLPTFADKILMEKFEDIDFVIRGEGENIFVELAYELENQKEFYKIDGLTYRKDSTQIYINPKRKLIKDLNQLPFPARDHIKYLSITNTPVAISTSRGCRGNCIYCSISEFYHKCDGEKWRSRNAINIVDEIEMIVNTYKKTDFIFVDDEFMGYNTEENSHVIEFVNEVKKRNLKISFKIFCRCDHVSKKQIKALKSIGMYSVFLGVESFSNKRLKFMGKGINVETNYKAIQILEEENVMYAIGFIPMDIYVTLDEVEEEYKGLLNINDNENFIGNPGIASRDIKMLPYFGSPYYTLLKNKKKLIGEFPSYTYIFEDKDVNRLFDILSQLDISWIDNKLTINVESVTVKYKNIVINTMKKINARRRKAEINLVLELIPLIRNNMEKYKINSAIEEFYLRIIEILDDINSVIEKIME